MFRRSRFSVRPNVGTAGKTAATPQEVTPVNQEASEIPKDVSESISGPAVTDNKSVLTPAEKSTGPGDGSDQNGDGSSSSAAVQRRKRFSVKPKVAPGRPTTLARTTKSPVKALSETPVEASGSDFDKPATSSQTAPTADPQGLKSPRRRRHSEDVKQPKPTSIPNDNSAPSAVPSAEDSLEQTHLPADSGKKLESTSGSHVKEVPPRPPDRVPPFIPDKEAIELSEKAKTLVSSKNVLSLSPSALSLSRLLNDPQDLQRLAKAQKLRELLREERHKEKKLKKAKTRLKEYSLDPAKMTMRDLIHYLPMSNPMTSSLEQSTQENETVVPTSPGGEESPERAQEPEVTPKTVSQTEEENEEADEEQDDAIMVPQVKVAEDGSLIIDEESLTVEVQRAKGPNPAQDRDPIFERGSTTTYSSFRKGTCSKPWSSEETDMFFLAVSMVGTDFSMICQLFPHRARAEIKNKFKREERENAWRIDKAFRERRKLDIEYFSKLLEKILEFQKNKKKLKSLATKKSPKKQRKRKAKGKKAAKMSDVEEEDEEDDNHPDLEDEEGGEKENELLCNEGETAAPKPKKKRKTQTGKDASNEEPSNKKNKSGEKSIEQGEPCIPEDSEAALPEETINSDISEKSNNANAKDTAVKPAKLARGRAPKPLLPLGRKWGKKVPPPSTEAKGGEDDRVSDGAAKEKEKEDASPPGTSANDENSSEEEEAAVPPPRPTRYGRLPKPTKHLTYPCKDDEHSSASETTPSLPMQHTASAAKPKPKCTTKRGRSSMPQPDKESKKPKLVTLRASKTDYSDDENDQQCEEEEVEEEQPACSPSKDSIAPAFVPASLRSPPSKISTVEEAMEELDILANMPDVLGISQDALCPDASCEQAQNEMGTAEPCEHQLDLLVDVIDFLSSEQTEESENESYNEAAQTLLTIGNLTHLFQATQTQDHITGTTSNSETHQQDLEGEIPSNPSAYEQTGTPASSNCATETSEAGATLEIQNSTADSGDTDPICNEQWTGSDKNHVPQLQSSPETLKKNSPQTTKKESSVVEPKLCQPSRTAQLTSQPETSAVVQSDIEPVPEEAAPEITECTLPSLKDIPCDEIKLTEEPSGSEGRSLQSPCFSHGQFEPILEHANQETKSMSSGKDENPISHPEIESGSNNSVASDVLVMSVEQGSKTDSVQGQEVSHCAGSVSPVEDLPDTHKAESEVASTLQSRRSRLQKVKPKPNLPQTSRTARPKPQVTKSSIEKDVSPVPKAKAEVEPEQTSSTPPEKSTENSGTASDLTSSLDLGPTPEHTQELSTAEEKSIDDGLFGQVGSSVTTSGGSSSENQDFCEEKLPTGFIAESHADLIESCSNLTTTEILITKPQVEQGSNPGSVPVQEGNGAGSVPPVEDFSHKSEGEVASTYRSKRSRSQKVIPKPNLLQTSRTVRPKAQTTKISIEKDLSTTPDVEPEQTCAPLPAETAQSTVSASDPSQDLSSTLKQTEEFSTTEVKNTDVGLCAQVDSSTATSGLSASEDQNLSRVQIQLQHSGEQDSGDTTPLSESIECPVSSKSAVTELKSGLGSPSNLPSRPESSGTTVADIEAQPTCGTIFPEESSTGTASVSALSMELDMTHQPTEEHKTDVGFGLDSSSESSEPNVPQRRRRFPKVKPKPNLASSTRTSRSKLQPSGISQTSEQHMDTSSNVTVEQQSVSTGAVELNTQQTDDSATFSNVQFSEDGTMESKINSVLTKRADPKESSDESCRKSDSEEKSQNAAQQCSEIIETNQTSNKNPQSAHSTDESQSQPSDSTTSLGKAPPQRGRLIKPRPNLRRSSQTPKPQQVQNTTQEETDSGTCSNSVVASVSQNPLSVLTPDKEPVEGAVEQHSKEDSAGSSLGCLKPTVEQLTHDDRSSNDAGTSLECFTVYQVPSTQNAPTSNSEGTQSHPCLNLFPDMLSEQVPSDPDEPFFILSLTEIPVSSSGEVVDSAAEPLSYLPVTDASIPQQSGLPGESLAAVAAGDAALLSEAPVTITTEKSGEMSLTNVKDTGVDATNNVDLNMKNPVDAHEMTTVETVENNNDTEIPTTKKRLRGTERGAKLQVKPTKERTKQRSKTLATNTIQDPHNLESSVKPEASGATTTAGRVVTETQKESDDQVDAEKETLTCAQDSSSGGTRVTKSAAPSSNPPSCKAVSKNSKQRTPRAAGKKSSTKRHNIPTTPSPTQLPDVAPPSSSTTSPTQTEVGMELDAEYGSQWPDLTTSTSQCTAEVSTSQQSDYVESSSIEEEPTSVSQYFLSDIFTEVEEG
ncbi:transcription factor TFIIIB component B'' homolog isoform X2 [Anabas testudineus]|uniref:transcription factor TFIIIB component B'' homolog isoform X2 n=1 Tax=Anabas testudineus TaxID=64144 RepID=UPI000E45554B|nr:transcription factor TFIIIB component B'' homolog isoform X2 [Anabas testudineus]